MTHEKGKIQNDINYVKKDNYRLADIICKELQCQGVTTFKRGNVHLCGMPDIIFEARKLAVFCEKDDEYGYDEIKVNDFLGSVDIQKDMKCDTLVTKKKHDWKVLQFGEHEITGELNNCIKKIIDELRVLPEPPYKTIDLCAGIGGIRKGFELTGFFYNVLSAEIDKYACKTYQHLYGDNPQNDLTSEEFKKQVESTDYDILLAGFPCQTFSRVGFQEGFGNEEKGHIFFHIADIIKRTRPVAIFLENVERIVTHDEGKTFKKILYKLEIELGYHIIGVKLDEEGTLNYNPKSFIRNSRDFGIPQNRPRTYIMGFDTERFYKARLDELPSELPQNRAELIYKDLNEVLEHGVSAKYYMATGYLETLINHRKRQEEKGYGFGYRIINDSKINKPIANTLMATGGSGRERNLIYDPQNGIAGMRIKGKKTPLNNSGIRIMTPVEWGKLQGFINYAFKDENGCDTFSFPSGVSDAQKYKQFGNSVTIPVIEKMAQFLLECINTLKE